MGRGRSIKYDVLNLKAVKILIKKNKSRKKPTKLLSIPKEDRGVKRGVRSNCLTPFSLRILHMTCQVRSHEFESPMKLLNTAY